jgi:hypothetical protein
MAKKVFEADVKCKACGGTGLYVGFAEKDGSAVICHDCKGTGKFHFRYEYEEFTKRATRNNVKWILQNNPGIGIGEGNGFKFSDFGGMSYKDWKSGKKFDDSMAMKKYTCPAWWYQSVDYKRKPNWETCPGIGSFSDCPHFKTKEKCWSRFEKEGK